LNPRKCLQIAGYSSETWKHRFASDCVVVVAVMCELVSGSRIPCKRGKNREFSEDGPDFMKTRAQSCNDFNAVGFDFPTKAIREFFRS